AKIVRYHHLRNTAKKLKRAHVTQQPVLQRLSPGGFCIGVIGGTQYGDKDLSRADLAGLRVDDGDRGAAVINEALFTGLVSLTHGARLLLQPMAVAITILRVA